MFFELYTAIRLSRNDNKKNISLTRLTVIGVSLSIFVILMSMSVIKGFKKEIREFVYSQTGHISIYSQGGMWNDATNYMLFDERMYKFFQSISHVNKVIPVVQGMGILKTKDNFEGIVLYGFEGDNYPDFYKTKTDKKDFIKDVTNIQNPILLPENTVSKLNYKVGDKVLVYFNNKDGVKVRSFTLCGVYHSVGSDVPIAIVDISVLRNVYVLDNNHVSRVMINFDSDKDIDQYTTIFADEIKKHGYDYIGDNVFFMNTARELIPNLFDWLDLLDTNVYFLFVLMVLVAGFTMITGFVILVLDKNNQIGILKSLGVKNISIQTIFILISSKVAIKGIFIGNILYALFFFIQSNFKIIKLDPKSYYVSYVPLAFDSLDWLLVNTLSFVAIILFTIYPSVMTRRRMHLNIDNQ